MTKAAGRMRRDAAPPSLLAVQTFVVLCERLSFPEAATRLGISTAATIGLVRSVELFLGQRLVAGSIDSVRLTPRGREVLFELEKGWGRAETLLRDTPECSQAPCNAACTITPAS